MIKSSSMELLTLLLLLIGNIVFSYGSEEFKFGDLQAGRKIGRVEGLSAIRACFSEEEEGDRHSILVYRHYMASIGKTIPDAARRNIQDEFLISLSHTLNACSTSEYIQSDNPNKATLVELEEMRKEFLLQASLAVFPSNNMAAKNLAYEYEWLPYVNSSLPISVLTQSMDTISYIDEGMILQHAFVAPTYLWDETETFFHHISILNRAWSLLQSDVVGSVEDATLHIRELQLNTQYLGLSPGVLSIAYAHALKRLYPRLEASKLQAVSVATGNDDSLSLHYLPSYESARFQDNIVITRTLREPSPAGVLRLGIVSEHEDNSSPGNCLKQIFMRLATFVHPDPVTGELTRDIEFIFFKREGSRTVFTATVAGLSERTYDMDQAQGNLELNRNTIAAERLDVLLYIALPTEKLTSCLSHSRLAPVQVVFGVGHPLTSGSSNIDYSVVGADMFQSLTTLTREPPSVELCMQLAQHCYEELPWTGGKACSLARGSGCATGPGAPTFYSEQLVVLESLGYFLESHLEIYDEPIEPLGLAYESSCDHVNARLQAWGFSPNVTAEQLGCLQSDAGGTRTPRSVNLYACIQIPKKMHPSFDVVLAGILRADPRAVIMVGHKFSAFFPRLLERANIELDAVNSDMSRFTIEELHRRVLLVPRLPHFDYQQLLSLSSVFLNTFPFGAGITSSEAIATCVPVLVDATRSSILHLGLAQVRRLGADFASDLIVEGDVSQYVKRAVLMANLDGLHGTSLENFKQGELPVLRVQLYEPEVREMGNLGAYRRALCRRRAELLGEKPLIEAANEWADFLKSISI